MKPEHNIREIFSEPIILQEYTNTCPGCGSSLISLFNMFPIKCIENYINDASVPVRVFECDHCGAMWEVEDKKEEKENGK